MKNGRKKSLAIARAFGQRLHPFPAVDTPATSGSSPVADQSRWFAEEVHAHDTSLKAYLRGTFPAVRDVDDVVQESYLRIWRAQHQRPIQCARAFLFRVARNVALNLLGRESTSPVVAVEDLNAVPVADDRGDAAAVACAQEELLLLARAIDSLPARCREIVVLRRIKNLSQKEIALRLGIAESTVEIQVVRGVKRCGDFLRRHRVRFEHETRS